MTAPIEQSHAALRVYGSILGAINSTTSNNFLSYTYRQIFESSAGMPSIASMNGTGSAGSSPTISISSENSHSSDDPPRDDGTSSIGMVSIIFGSPLFKVI